MMTADQPQSETPRQKEFQDSLRILKGITSWQLWSSVLMMVLLAGAIVFLLFRASEPTFPVLALLVLGCAVSGFTLHRQSGALKLLRAGLIDQTNSVIKQRAKAEQFYGMATQDALTGLYNRRFGETRLKEEIERAEKSGESLILIAADFDKFKHINDTYGHAAGDLALKEFSRRLQRAVRACDVPIRVGGDEFLVIFPECTLEKIPEIMSRMDSISFPFEGKKIPVSFSYGSAQYEPNDTSESILKRADERLYAKKAKRKAARQEEARALVADAGFRRSERLPFEMPVQVYVSREKEEQACEEAKTLSVNAHGALLALSTPVENGQTLWLVNPRTQQEMECRVCRFATERPSGVKEVSVEFATVAPVFWDVPSIPADWDPARQQVPLPTDGGPRVAPHKDAISHLSDDIGRALRGSGSPEWSPPWAPKRAGEASATANADAATQLSSNIDALSVIWDDTEPVKDVSRAAGLDPTWTPQRGHELPKASRRLSAVHAAGTLQIEARTIMNEALREQHGLSEKAASATTATAALPRKWLLLALAFPVVLITVWLAIPRSSGRAASASVRDQANSRQPGQEAAGMTSSPAAGAGLSQPAPSGEATQKTPSQSLDASVLGEHPCIAADASAPGVSMEMTRIMPRGAGVRLATKEDFDPEAVSWLQNGGQDVSSQIAGDFTGVGESRGYLWVGKNKSWRVVLLANNQARCDVSLPSVAIAAWVPKESINRIRWDGPAPEPSGDGLLIVRSAKDPSSGVFLSLRGNEIVGSRPADYRQVPLGERSVAKAILGNPR